MSKITLKPCAKINLGLYILRKRPDSYHDIQTCFFAVENWTDQIEYQVSNEFKFESIGRAIPNDGKPNLCERAFFLMKERFNIPNVSVVLDKRLPIGGGLGGGSSDAAFFLKSLNDKFLKNPLSNQQLRELAAELGSDCAFFIEAQKTQIAEGRGEILRPLELNLPKSYLLVLCPDIHVSTAQAYKGVEFSAPKRDFELILSQPRSWKSELHNGFETTVFKNYPFLQELKQQLYQSGSWYASMSGSGACVFGFFLQKPDTKPFENIEFWLGSI